MPTAEAGLLTVADYMKLPEDGPRYELIEGELLLAPAPNRFHQEIVFNLTLILGNHVRKKRLGKIYTAPFDVIFDQHNVLQPDIIFFSNARASALTKAGASGAPDLAIEILSLATEKRDRVQKRAIYARSGVEELWLVLPDKRRLEIYRLSENAERAAQTLGEGAQFAPKLFPGLTISIAEIFAA